MASYALNFNQIQRRFFNVTLKDYVITNKNGEEIQRKGELLTVKMPVKSTFHKLSAVQNMDIDSMSLDDAMDTMSEIVAETLSNNLQRKKISAKTIANNYDFEEMTIFIDKYMEFVQGAAEDPN